MYILFSITMFQKKKKRDVPCLLISLYSPCFVPCHIIFYAILTPRACARGKVIGFVINCIFTAPGNIQSMVLSVVVCTKITRSQDLDIHVSCKHNKIGIHQFQMQHERAGYVL